MAESLSILCSYREQLIYRNVVYPLEKNDQAGGHSSFPPEIAMIDSRTAPYAALVLRLALGAMFLAHGLMKLLVFTLPGTAQFFQSVGLPGSLGIIVTFAELGAGVLLILGLQSRIVALATIPILLGAASVHWGNGWVFSAPKGGWEYPVFLAVAALAQGLLGDGAYAVASVLRPALRLRQA
jgi:putative oxidoreductase